MADEQPLADYLAARHAALHYVGAVLHGVDLRDWVMRLAVYLGGKVEWVSVRAVGTEDWCLAPNHVLLEGADSLDVVTHDPKLTREYLESLDCEGCRTEYPDQLIMLRNGNNWVIAHEFFVTVEATSERWSPDRHGSDGL